MKKVFVLFVSYASGEHGLTIHKSMEELKSELKSNVMANEDTTPEQVVANRALADSAKAGGYGEFSDGTWFSIFEKELE